MEIGFKCKYKWKLDLNECDFLETKFLEYLIIILAH